MKDGFMSGRRAITRVKLRNYKSIEFCNVELNPLTILVGPNGSGKSNFLDALGFLEKALNSTLEVAIQNRGGFDSLRKRHKTPGYNLEIHIEMELEGDAAAIYDLQLGGHPFDDYWVYQESCRIGITGTGEFLHHFDVIKENLNYEFSTSVSHPPAYSPGQLYLTRLSGEPEFRDVFEILSRMKFYSFNPDEMQRYHPSDPGDSLNNDGSNVASVLQKLSRTSPEKKTRLEQYLNAIVPGIIGVDRHMLGKSETVQFKQVLEEFEESNNNHIEDFLALNMSDGTLRALGILTSLFQYANSDENRFSIIGIEEPETGLHPKALRAIFDAVDEANDHVQILMTSHSPEIVDMFEGTDHLLAVEMRNGATIINRLDAAGKRVIDGKFYTPGQLLLIDQLLPEDYRNESVLMEAK